MSFQPSLLAVGKQWRVGSSLFFLGGIISLIKFHFISIFLFFRKNATRKKNKKKKKQGEKKKTIKNEKKKKKQEEKKKKEKKKEKKRKKKKKTHKTSIVKVCQKSP